VEDFRIASRVFWTACSANARGVTPQKRQSLLELVSNANQKHWHELTEYQKAWKAEYDDVVQIYVQKFEHYLDKFMQSDAGKAFKELAERRRKSHGTIPEFNSHFILRWNDKIGIDWDTRHILDIFSKLEELHTTIDYPNQVWPDV
jgi:hypothetical protein